MRDEQRVRRDAQCGSLGSGWFDRTLCRRSFVGAVTAVMWGLALGRAGPGAAAAAESVQVWGLDPCSTGGRCSCAGCSACRSHAANKLFATAAAADAKRAHPGCRCQVVALGEINRQLYDALFPAGGIRLSVDRRYPWVQEVSGRFAGGPPVTPEPTVDDAGDPSRDLAEATPIVVGAAEQTIGPRTVGVSFQLRAVRFAVDARNRRVLLAKIAVAQPGYATLTLRRAHTVLAVRTLHLDGLTTIGLSIPAATDSGPGSLEIRFRDRAGRTTLITRHVLIRPRVVHKVLAAR